MTIFYFFKINFLGFYKAELESEDIFVLRRVSFVDLEVSYDVLSPLPIVLSKHFNHPHPYIEITTTISDTKLTNKHVNYLCRYAFSMYIIWLKLNYCACVCVCVCLCVCV